MNIEALEGFGFEKTHIENEDFTELKYSMENEELRVEIYPDEQVCVSTTLILGGLVDDSHTVHDIESEAFAEIVEEEFGVDIR